MVDTATEKQLKRFCLVCGRGYRLQTVFLFQIQEQSPFYFPSRFISRPLRCGLLFSFLGTSNHGSRSWFTKELSLREWCVNKRQGILSLTSRDQEVLISFDKGNLSPGCHIPWVAYGVGRSLSQNSAKIHCTHLESTSFEN